MSKLREDLADYAHETWCGWMRYMFHVCTELDRTEKEVILSLPAKTYDRWQRQMNTLYANLPVQEKDSDRREADRILSIIHFDYPSR